VVVARDNFFSDALTGGPLADAVNGPLLTTQGANESATIDPRTLAEIQRVLPAGGPSTSWAVIWPSAPPSTASSPSSASTSTG